MFCVVSCITVTSQMTYFQFYAVGGIKRCYSLSNFPFICLSVCLSHAHRSTTVHLGLWFLQNTNRKRCAGSRTICSLWPYGHQSGQKGNKAVANAASKAFTAWQHRQQGLVCTAFAQYVPVELLTAAVILPPSRWYFIALTRTLNVCSGPSHLSICCRSGAMWQWWWDGAGGTKSIGSALRHCNVRLSVQQRHQKHDAYKDRHCHRYLVVWENDRYSASVLLFCFLVSVKFSRTRYRALGPELIPVYRQSTCRWL